MGSTEYSIAPMKSPRVKFRIILKIFLIKIMNSLQVLSSCSNKVRFEEVSKSLHNTTRDFVIYSPIKTHIPEFFQSIKSTVETLVDSSRQRDIVKVSLGVRVTFKNTEGNERSYLL